MANQLNRVLQPGDEIVVLSRYMGGTFPPAARTFRCSHGAGMHPTQPGTGIWGCWSGSGKEDRIDSYMIEACCAPAPAGESEVETTLRLLRNS
jgi:hypothetical protein